MENSKTKPIFKNSDTEKSKQVVKPLKSRDSYKGDHMTQAITVGRGINKFERPLRDKQINGYASQDLEYPFYPEPPQSEKIENSRRQSFVSNKGSIFSRKMSLHPEDAYDEPYEMERAMGPSQMPLSRLISPATSQRQSVPVIKEPGGKVPISLLTVGKIATMGHTTNIKMEEQKPFSGISFKMVAMAVKSFLTQQRIIMAGIAPKIYKHKFKMKFDWSKFKHFVQSTKALEKPSSSTRIFQMKAPAVVAAKQTVNQYMNHFQQMEDEYEDNEYDGYNMPHPPRGPKVQGRMQRRMSRSQENLPHADYNNLSPYHGHYNRRQSHMFTHQPRSFDGPSPDRIKRYPVLSGARNIERARDRTPGRNRRDYSTIQHNRDHSSSRYGRDTSRSRSFTQQEVDEFLYEQGMPNNYVEYDNADYQDDQGHRQYYNEEHTGRDDGYWEEEDESSDGFEPLPHLQQELPHGERYKMLPPEYFAQRGRDRHSPGRQGNRFYDSSPEEVERRSHRSRRSSHKFNDNSPEDGRRTHNRNQGDYYNNSPEDGRRSHRNQGDYYSSSPEDTRRGYYGNQSKHSSPDVTRRSGYSNRSEYNQPENRYTNRKEFLDPKYDSDEMLKKRSSSKDRYSHLDTERSKDRNKIYADEANLHDISPRGRKKKQTKFGKTKKKSDGPMTMKEYNKLQDDESDSDDTDKMDTDEVTTGLKCLDTYGSMFRNQLVLDAIAVEGWSMI